MKPEEWRKVWLSVGATAGLLAVVWFVGTALAQGPDGGETLAGDVSLGAMVDDRINYQGRLTDPGGVPLDGTFPMSFQIYDSGGTMRFDSGVMDVDVDHGLFNVEVRVDPTLFDGQALWLQIYVDGEWLTPRQKLVPVPYALSLRPGALIKGVEPATCGAVLDVENDGGHSCGMAVKGISATGSAVWGESTGGWGVRGYSENNYAVFGSDGGTTQGQGYGGYFESTTGVGVYGYSSAEIFATNTQAPGVYGRSEGGVGVYGVGEGSAHPAYGGMFTSENYRGLYAKGAAGKYDAYFDGDIGIRVGATAYADNLYSWNDVYVGGDLTVIGTKTGYVVDIALNDGPDPLELGDVVVITGAAEPIMGSIPVPRVQKATEANSTGVIGVVDRRFVTAAEGLGTQETEAESPGYFEDSAASLAGAGGIAPGEYVGVVTLGSFSGIKVDASYGAIQPGDLLVSSDTPGYAMKATDPQVGTVIGKALGSLDSGTGVIPVLVTLH